MKLERLAMSVDEKKTIIFTSDGKELSYDDTCIYEGLTCKNIEDIDGYKSAKEYAINVMREQYSKILSRQFDNIVVLSGAGTSIGIGCGNKKGQSVSGLWEKVVSKIGKDNLEKFAEAINYEKFNIANTNLEVFLSKALISEAYNHQELVSDGINIIESVIREECDLTLPENSPHEIFLKSITSRKLKYSRVKIFTLNYDLLFEQAASKGGYVVIDGFSFTVPRVFNGVNFDYDIVIRNNQRSLTEDNYAPKVFHLYKPHGSLDWEKINNHVEKNKNPETPVMIYPSASKYEASYEQPYFEMISRFQNELRKTNTLLLVIGFSFYDKHLDTMITEAMNSNPSLSLMIVDPYANENDCFNKYRERALKQNGVSIISEKFEDFVKYYPYSKIYNFSEDIKHYESIQQ